MPSKGESKGSKSRDEQRKWLSRLHSDLTFWSLISGNAAFAIEQMQRGEAINPGVIEDARQMRSRLEAGLPRVKEMLIDAGLYRPLILTRADGSHESHDAVDEFFADSRLVASHLASLVEELRVVLGLTLDPESDVDFQRLQDDTNEWAAGIARKVTRAEIEKRNFEQRIAALEASNAELKARELPRWLTAKAIIGVIGTGATILGTALAYYVHHEVADALREHESGSRHEHTDKSEDPKTQNQQQPTQHSQISSPSPPQPALLPSAAPAPVPGVNAP